MFDAFKQFENFQKYFDGMFDQNFSQKFEKMLQTQSFPPTNIYRSDNELFVVLNIPGLYSMEKLNIYVEKNLIEVSGEVRLDYRGFECTQQEISAGRFERTIPLPYPVIENRVDASYHKGLVLVHLHRLIPNPDEHYKVEIREIEE